MKTIADALVEQGLDAGYRPLVNVPAAVDHEVRLLPVVARAYELLVETASREGVQIVAVSGYRSPQRQAEIWNRKFVAARESGLDEAAALAQNLVYSAPPGWSRHHWGTDLDLVGGALAGEPRLEAEDWEAGGPCHEAGLWLARRASLFGFLKPYDADHGGFSPEPWHFSFAPAAIAFLPLMRRIPWDNVVRPDSFEGAALLKKDMDAQFARFVLGVQPRLKVAVSR